MSGTQKYLLPLFALFLLTPLFVSAAYSNETANRSFDTNYQNTTGFDMQVCVYGYASRDGYQFNTYMDAFVSSSTPATELIGRSSSPNISSFDGEVVDLCVFVPDQYYYRFYTVNAGSAGGVSLYSWIEYTLDFSSGGGSGTTTLTLPDSTIASDIVLTYVFFAFLWIAVFLLMLWLVRKFTD